MIQREKIVKSFGWKLLERCSSQAISLLVTIILARVILPHDFGVIALIIVFIDIANVIIDGGLNTALIQKKIPTKQTIRPFSISLWEWQQYYTCCFSFYHL